MLFWVCLNRWFLSWPWISWPELALYFKGLCSYFLVNIKRLCQHTCWCHCFVTFMLFELFGIFEDLGVLDAFVNFGACEPVSFLCPPASWRSILLLVALGALLLFVSLENCIDFGALVTFADFGVCEPVSLSCPASWLSMGDVCFHVASDAVVDRATRVTRRTMVLDKMTNQLRWFEFGGLDFMR